MASIQELRDSDPDLQGLDDEQVVDVIHQAYYPDMDRGEVAKALGVTPPPPPPPERGFWSTVGDAGLSAVKGAVGLPEAVVGLGDIATGGRVGKALEEGVELPGTDGFRLRFDPKAARDVLDDQFSDAQKAANKRVQDAEGIWNIVKEAVKNPSVVAHSVIESGPSMILGGAVARGAASLPLLSRVASALGPKLAPLYFGAMGEGIVGAGSSAEQIRQQTKDGLLTGDQAALAGASGAATSLFGIVGGKIANRFDFADVDTMLAGAAVNDKAAGKVAKQILEGFISEGALEELPQSISEQVAQNMALGKPLDEGVPHAAVLGFFAGGLMGGGANALHAMRRKPEDKTAPGAAPAPSAGAAPAAAPAPTPADVAAAPTVDDAIDMALKAAGVNAPAAPAAADTTPSVEDLFPKPAGGMIGGTAAAEEDPFARPQFTAQGAQSAPETIPPVAGSAGAAGPAAAVPVLPGVVSPDGAGAAATAAPAQLPAGGAGSAQPAPEQPAAPVAQPAGRGDAGVSLPPAKGESEALADVSRATPEKLALQLARATAAVGEAQGRFDKNPSDANRLFLADAQDVQNAVRTQMDDARAQDAAAWARYEEDQKAVSSLPEGARVETPDGPGTIVKKFPRNWQVAVDGAGRRLLPPGALKPLAGSAPQPTGNAGSASQTTESEAQAAPSGAPAAPAKPANPEDELYARAVELVTGPEGRGSISFVQRHLTIGYNKAAALLERMEREGVVGPMNNQGQRDVLARKEQPRAQEEAAAPAPAPADSGAAQASSEAPDTAGAAGDAGRAGGGASAAPAAPVAQDKPQEQSGDDYAAAGAEWTRMRDIDRRVLLEQKAKLPKYLASKPWKDLDAFEREKIGNAMGFMPTYAQRKVLNAHAIIDWARGQGFKDIEAADKLHVTIAFSRKPMDPLAVGNQSPSYQKGVITGTSGREVARLGDEGAIVLKFASPVLQSRWQQFNKAGASWDFESYQPHITISYGDKGLDLSKIEPYKGPIELGPELHEPLDTTPREEKDTSQQAAPSAQAPSADEGKAENPAPAREPAEAAPKPTPQVTDPGTKYVLPSFVSGRGRAPNVKINRLGLDGLTDEERAAGKRPYTDAPAPRSGADALRSENMSAIRDEGSKAAREDKPRLPPEWMSGESRDLWFEGYDAAIKANPALAQGASIDATPPQTSTRQFTLSSGNRVRIGDEAQTGSFHVRINDGPGSWTGLGTFKLDANGFATGHKARANWAMQDVREAAALFAANYKGGPKAAPAPVNMADRIRADGDKAIEAARAELPDGYTIEDVPGKGLTVKAGERVLVEGISRSNATEALRQAKLDDEKQAAPAPAPEKKGGGGKPEVSKNTVFTDDMAAAARARLKAKLGRLGSGIDPEMLQDGIVLAGHHIEKGARTFAAYAKAMLEDMGESIRPYLKQFYMAVKYDPRAGEMSKDMSSAAFVDEFDMAAIAAPSYTDEAQQGDTGEQDGTATRGLDRAGEGAHEGAPAAGVRAPGEGGGAGAVSGGRGQRGERGDGAADSAGGDVGRGLGAGTGAAVPGRGERAGSAGDGRIQGAPRADSGSESPADAGREGGRGVAPNAAPTPANQYVPAAEDFTIEDDLALGEGGQKTKFRNNIAAIRLVKDLAETGRQATADEQRALAKYVGWGGLPQAFDANNADWGKEYAELKELLTPEEYDAARRSTRYAHYTSREIVVDGIYAALARFGFHGGRVLEGGAGVGNFIGLMPKEMRTNGRVTAIERELIAGTIAKNLYPLQNVQLADFTEFKGNDGFFDAAVGNPPFASDPQVDKSGRKHLNGLSLHNYFFAKEVDMLREGGILAQVVTNSFLDAAGDRARQYIAERTKFLGAIRLPNNAFSKNAGTEVTTDIIFLQKRPESEWGSKAAKEEAKQWLDVRPYQGKSGDPVNLNVYFHANPDMMLGDFGGYGTMYGPNQPALVARAGQDTLAMLKAAVQKLPEGIYKSIAETGAAAAIDAEVQALKNPPVQEGGFFVQDGKVMQRLQDLAGEARGVEITPETQWTEKTKLGSKDFDRIKRLAEMRGTLRALLAAELTSDPKMEDLRKTLNEQYDGYRKEHGLLGDRATYRVFDDDPDFPLLLSLEHNYTPGIGPAEAKKLGIKPTKSSAKKSPIFERRVVEARTQVRKVETPADALAVSMAERGRLDTAYIGELLGRDPQDALEEMTQGDKPLLFLDPASDEYVLRDAYLSGNVRQKLAQAKAASMAVNVRELEKVQPEDVPAHEISAKIGAPWVPLTVYEDFAKDLFGDGTKASITYTKLNSSYGVYITPGSEVNNSNKWGIPAYSGTELLSALLNNRTIKVAYKDRDGKTVTDVEKTEMANTKAQEIKDRFNDWLMADPDRSALLTRAYNDANNNYVTREYDGSWMTFPGKVPDSVIKFRRHQRNAIARIVQDRTTLLDHVVGAGKTFTVIAGLMELKRTGLANKPMVAVPNHLVKQWAADFYRLYPGANILAASKKDFERVNRRRFLAKIATGNWDAVVIAHSSFGFINPGAEFEAQFNQRQIELIVAAMKDVDESDADEKQKKRTVKQLEGMKERLENRIDRLRDKPMDDLLDFAELGVDQLAVDEAHLFKNLMYQTKLQNVAGLGDAAGSKRAYDMYVKTQQVMEQNGRGQGVIFATGTPVSNSLAEKYHMMRYLMPRQMDELGFQSFDAWANTYAEVRQHWMQKVSGDGFKAQNRMSEFVNVHELLKLFDQVADTVTNDDIKKAYREENNGEEYPLPPVKGGKPRLPVSLDRSPAQVAYMEELARRAAVVEARKGPPKKGDDNHLSLMTDARKAAMDMRLVDMDMTEREKGGRIDRAADEIVTRFKQWDHVKGTQLVFSDLGTPKKHAEKELKEYQRLQAIIAEATDEIRDRAALGDERAQGIVDAAEDAEKELDEQGPDWLTAVKAALRGFSVYDDLKDALVERGIPEAQIAFIHDYNTDDQKAALFRKVNAGDIRILMGSTPKMGAGTNVQERLVALHHLDVPWKPSDVEQREGRIVRQGNVLLKHAKNPAGIDGFEVEILAYVTKDTLDMRMWQIQEVKLKVINQLRTRQIERNIDNAFEDMEMSASEMQAAATGNMDLLVEIQARNDIKKLEQKKRSFEAQKNDLIGRKKSVERRLQNLPKQIEQAKDLEKLSQAYKTEVNDSIGAFKATIDGKEFTDSKEAGDYLRSKVDATFRTRTVEKDGKKVREELTNEEYQKLVDAAEALRAGGKTNEDPEVQALIDQMIGFKETAAPLDVEMNGERFTARAKLAEAFSNLTGDRSPLLWKLDGQKYNRRAAAATAIRQLVADAVADEKPVTVGELGPWTVHIEGNPPDKKGERVLDMWIEAPGGQKVDGQMYLSEDSAKETPRITEKVIEWADRAASNAGNDRFYLERDLEAAQRQKKELDAADELGDWPDMPKLEEARKKHQEVLQRLAKAKKDGGDKPAFYQGEGDATAANRRKVGELQQKVDAITEGWAQTLPVTVVSTIDSPSVPAKIREANAENKARGGGSGVGVIYRGEVWIFADKVKDDRELATVLYHEVLGHAGLRGHFGPELDRVLNQVAMLRRDDVRRMIERNGMTGPRVEQRAAEEVLAYLAQTQPQLSLVQRALAAIRTFLREHVPGFRNLELSDAELIRNFILPARQFIEGGGGPGPRGGLDFSQDAPNRPFYSALSRAMEAVPAKALPVAGWTGAIQAQINKGAVKADEVEWSGIREWLQLQEGSKIAKADVLDYLQANGVRVEEVVKGGAVTNAQDFDRINVELTALGFDIDQDALADGPEVVLTRRSDRQVFTYDEDAGAVVDMDGNALDNTAVHLLAAEALRHGREQDGDDGDAPVGTRYGQYTLPGGDNYREMLLTLPQREPAAGEQLTYTQPYRSNHWSEDNIVAHIRMNERTDAEGKRVLFIEELQSDWAQQGRRDGFKKNIPFTNFESWAEAKGLDDATSKRVWKNRYDPAQLPLEEAKLAVEWEEFSRDMANDSARVPRAPFVDKTDAWLSLALKRIVKYAVDNGFERVAFVNGKQSADRYSLSTAIKEAEWHADTYAPITVVTLMPRDGRASNIVLRVRQNDSQMEIAGGPYAGKSLPDVVGKGLAEKIMSEESGRLRDLELDIGGDGMRSFYDKIVPAALGKLLPKLGGGKVKPVAVERGTYQDFKDSYFKIVVNGDTEVYQTKDLERAEKEAATIRKTWPDAKVVEVPPTMEQPGFDVTDAMREKTADGLPMFSQEAGLNNPRDFRALAREAVAEMNEGTPGKLHWWHKTLGTQYNLAQKSPLYKRVFNRVQDFLEDVSTYATEAADKAPSILPQLETWRDLLPAALGGSGKKPLSAADNKAIRAAVFEGTLEWTRDKYGNAIRVDDMREQAKTMTADEKAEQMVRNNQLHPNVLRMWRGLPHEQFQAMVDSRYENTALKAGIVWTDTELRKLFQLSGAQIGYYREFRASTDESITRAALSDMVRYVGEDADFIREEVMQSKDVKEGLDLLVEQLKQRAKDDPKRAGGLSKTVDKLEEKARRALDLMDKGYAPLMRFGHYTVTVHGQNEDTGEEEVKFFGMYENALAARIAAKNLETEMDDVKGLRIERGTMNEDSYKLFAGINPETVELFGEMLGMSETGDSAADLAFQSYLKLARNNRSAMKRLIHRKGTAGFSEDITRVLASFTYSTARLTSRNLHAGQIAEAVRDITNPAAGGDRNQGELARQATRLMEYVNNPGEEAQALRGLLFAQYLGGSIASALVNATQPFQVTMPYLSQYGGIGASVKRMGFALKKAWAASTGDRQLDVDLKKAVEEGIVAPQEVHQLMAMGQGKGQLRAGDGTMAGDLYAKGMNFGNRLMAAWGKPFSTAELFNRRVTFVAAYRTAQEEGMANPYDFAKRAVVETQFLYNKGNRPNWARGVVGATLMTFKQYSISYLELVERMWNAGEPGSPERAAGRRAVFFAAAMILLAGGAGGFPFVEDVEDVIDGLMQRLGYNWQSKQKLQELLQGAFGKAFGGFLEKGVSGLPGAPIDVSGRLGMGNLLPGTGIFQKKADHSRDVLEVAGPTGDLFSRAGKAVSAISEGEVGAGLRQGVPKAMFNWAKAVEMLTTGQYKDDRGYKVLDTTAMDALAKFIGFQPGAVAKVQEGDRAAQAMVNLAKTRESEIAAKWAKGIATRDQRLQQEARRELQAWNEKNPATPIKIRLQDVLRRAQKMMQPRAERILKSAPKEVRQEASRLMRED